MSGITKSTSFDIKVKKAYTLKEVGGRIFYIRNNNGFNYHFFNASGNELTTHTISGLANAYYYAIDNDATATSDKFYVYCTEDGTPTGSILISDKLQWGGYGTSQGTTADSLGSGKTNSAILINNLGNTSGTIWYWLKNTLNQASKNGCNDWFIGSKAEMDKLKSSGTTGASVFDSHGVWSSVEKDKDNACFWSYDDYEPYWSAQAKNVKRDTIPFRAF